LVGSLVKKSGVQLILG